MQAIYRQGVRRSVNFTAGESALAAGDVYVDGGIAGVATRPVAADSDGAMDIEGVFEVVKITEQAFTKGATVYWDAAGDPVGGTSGSGAADANPENVILGVCVAAALEDAATVLVKLAQDITPNS